MKSMRTSESVCQLEANMMAFKWVAVSRLGRDAPRGNRTRVKGVEDPHSTTELAARERDCQAAEINDKSVCCVLPSRGHPTRGMPLPRSGD
jgi:hypothetical protein